MFMLPTVWLHAILLPIAGIFTSIPRLARSLECYAQSFSMAGHAVLTRRQGKPLTSGWDRRGLRGTRAVQVAINVWVVGGAWWGSVGVGGIVGLSRVWLYAVPYGPSSTTVGSGKGLGRCPGLRPSAVCSASRWAKSSGVWNCCKGSWEVSCGASVSAGRAGCSRKQR